MEEMEELEELEELEEPEEPALEGNVELVGVEEALEEVAEDEDEDNEDENHSEAVVSFHGLTEKVTSFPEIRFR